MKKAGPLLLLIVAVLFSTGASIIDKETKDSILGLQGEINRLSRLGQARHEKQIQLLSEEIRLLKGLQGVQERMVNLEGKVNQLSRQEQIRYENPKRNELAATKMGIMSLERGVLDLARKIELLTQSSQDSTLATTINETKKGLATLETKLNQLIEQGKTGIAQGSQLLPILEELKGAQAEPLSPPVFSIPDRFQQEVRKTSSFSKWALLFSLLTVGLLASLLILTRRSERRIRRMIANLHGIVSDDSTPLGRPHLQMEANANRITLFNTGEMPADKIKLYLGNSHAMMKRKLRISSTIRAGEETSIDLRSSLSDDLLYATLEYTNPHSGRIYKDQFTLKADHSSGEFFPIQQAS